MSDTTTPQQGQAAKQAGAAKTPAPQQQGQQPAAPQQQAGAPVFRDWAAI